MDKVLYVEQCSHRQSFKIISKHEFNSILLERPRSKEIYFAPNGVTLYQYSTDIMQIFLVPLKDVSKEKALEAIWCWNEDCKLLPKGYHLQSIN